MVDMEPTRILHDKLTGSRFVKRPLTELLAARLVQRSVQHKLFPSLPAHGKNTIHLHLSSSTQVK